MDPPEGPLHQAPYNTPCDVAPNPRSLVQVAEQVYPLLQRRPPANRMREHRDNHAHEEVLVVGDAAPHLPKRVMSGGLEDAGKCGPGEGERMDELRGIRSSAIWHHGGLGHCRT